MLIGQTKETFYMNIVSLKSETFDSFLLKSHQIFKEDLVKALERYDRDIYCSIDHNRFHLIRIDERTILTTYGILTFKRRYYFDTFLKEYCYLLDNKLQIPKSKRMSNELILKILDLASIMSYKEVVEHLSNEFIISKYSVWKAINDVLLETYFDVDIDRKDYKVHVQIDEKYIGMVRSKNKKKYYTVTIFAGLKNDGKTNVLLNKTVISSACLKDIKQKINDLLINRYKVKEDEEIFISGDFATYIQHFDESITCCKSKYVPDKFHVYKTLKDKLPPDVIVDDLSLNDKGFKKYLIKTLSKIDDVDARKLKRLLVSNPKCFETYLDEEYLGCSQEGQNSHIYAPRFGKYANRFSPSTIEKLSLIREARAMKAKVILVHKKRKIPEYIDTSIPKNPYLEDPVRYVLDTGEMKYETAKMFNAIKYGGC